MPKNFSQRRPDGAGGWIAHLSAACPDWCSGQHPKPKEDARRVLYHLRQLLAADPEEVVWIPEGEKDVHALEQLGLVATTNPGGARKWRAEYNEWLRGRRVVIIVDKDKDGREHAEMVRASLVGVARSVRVLELPGEGKDVSDWLAAGGTVERLDRLVSELPEEGFEPDFGFGETAEPEAESSETSDKSSESPPPPPTPPPPTPKRRSLWRSYTLKELEGLKIPERKLIVAPTLGRQETSFTYGPKGHGKTWVELGRATIAAQGSGARFLNFTAPGPGVLTLYVDGEMLSRDIRQRARDVARTAGLDPGDNLKIWTPDAQPDGSPTINLFTEDGRKEMGNHISDIEDEAGRKVELVFLDNLRSLFPGWEENKAESFLPIGLWTIQQRAQGRSIALSHHSNRTGEYSGNTAIVTHVHSIVRVSHAGDYRADMGALFDVRYEYTRAKPEEGLSDFNAELEGDVWTVKPLHRVDEEAIRNLLRQGATYRDIAARLGISRWAVSQVAKDMEKASE